MLFLERRRHEHLHVATNHFGCVVTEHAGRCSINRSNAATLIDRDNGINRRFEHGPEVLRSDAAASFLRPRSAASDPGMWGFYQAKRPTHCQKPMFATARGLPR